MGEGVNGAGEAKGRRQGRGWGGWGEREEGKEGGAEGAGSGNEGRESDGREREREEGWNTDKQHIATRKCVHMYICLRMASNAKCIPE